MQTAQDYANGYIVVGMLRHAVHSIVVDMLRHAVHSIVVGMRRHAVHSSYLTISTARIRR